MKKWQNYINLLIVIAILFFVNVIANYIHGFIDLTEEKRYTLSPSTERVTEQIDDNMYIRVLLDGKFPAGFERLRNTTEELLKDLNDINPLIQYVFEDPSDGTVEEIKKRRDQLAEDGIIPTNLNYFDGKEYVQKGIYPYALISYKGAFSAISLLQEQASGQDENEVLNKSVELLEYKFANMFQKMESGTRKNIVFTTGHGELDAEQTIRLETELNQYYNVGRVHLDSVVHLSPKINLLIVAGPQLPFSDKDKFKIDQYVMNGGKIIWMMDNMDTSLDSISHNKFYVPRQYDTNLSDLFFKYGIRFQPNLILDLEASSIPQIVGEQGGRPQTSLFKWYYHVLASAKYDHPITRNIGRVNTFFPSTIDTVKTGTSIKNTVLLSSSEYSRIQLYPMRLNFEILKISPDPDKFNKGAQPIAILSKGIFPSLFKNRTTAAMEATLKDLNIPFKSESPVTSQLFISDAQLIQNVLNFQTMQAEPIGFNKWDRKMYEGNKSFIFNAIEYLIDDNGVLESRAKDIKLRLLDKVKTQKEETKWQLINIVVPIILLLLFGLLYNFIRRRKYAKN